MTNASSVQTPLKYVLILVAISFALTVALLSIFFAGASTGTGSSPQTAISLVNSLNTGVLGPNQQRWFRLAAGTTGQLKQSFSLVFTPVSLRQQISLQVYDEAQAVSASSPTPLGVGQWTPSVNSQQASGILWAGVIQGEAVYYVQVVNNSDAPIDYWLFAENEREPAPPPEPVQPTPTPDPPPPPVLGGGPSAWEARGLQTGLTRGRLQPSSTQWFTFSRAGLGGDVFQDLAFTLFFTPGAGNADNVNFQLFTPGEIAAWGRGERARPNNFGAGAFVSRDGDGNTGERLWRGVVLRDDLYYLAVENGTALEVDYYLYDQDIANPQLGTSPEVALSLGTGETVGVVAPGQEVWYQLSAASRVEAAFEETGVTMQIAQSNADVTLEILTAGEVEAVGLNSVGLAQVADLDQNPQTSERSWRGWLVDNGRYYVKVRNNAGVPVDYRLLTGTASG